MTTEIQTNTDMTTPSEQYVQPLPPNRGNTDTPRTPPVKRGLTRGTWIAILILLLVIAIVVVMGILSRSRSEHTLEVQTAASAIPTVSVVYPKSSTLSSEIALPGNTQAFVDTPIFARTNGYLKKWFYDIGARVHKGDLMATIETPELDQQLQVAEGNLKSAEANLELANITSTRYQNLLKTNSVSKQETDVATGDAAARKAAVAAAEASVRQLQQMQSFEKVYAPYDGIVTARNTDIGDLISAGTSTTPKELFHVAEIGKLRVFVAVPEVYAPMIKGGEKATLTLDEYPNREFAGTVARNSNAIDNATRTLNVEVDVNNPKGELLPGAYVFVHFKVPEHAASLMIPSNTLLFRTEGLQVAVVRNNHVHLTDVTIAKDNGATVEIATGLTAQDAVILDPSDAIADGQEVRIANHPQDPVLGKPSEGGSK